MIAKRISVAMKSAYKLLCWFTILLVSLNCSSRASDTQLKVDLNPSQILEFDQTGWISLTSQQRARVKSVAGFAPTRVRPIYKAPDGEVGELGYNLAIRTNDRSIDILRNYLIPDQDVKKKVAQNKSQLGALPQSQNFYPSFIVDSDGRYWKYLSYKELTAELRSGREMMGVVYVHLPQSLRNVDSVAARDGLRKLKTVLDKLGIPISVIASQ